MVKDLKFLTQFTSNNTSNSVNTVKQISNLTLRKQRFIKCFTPEVANVYNQLDSWLLRCEQPTLSVFCFTSRTLHLLPSFQPHPCCRLITRSSSILDHNVICSVVPNNLAHRSMSFLFYFFFLLWVISNIAYRNK